MTGKSSTRADWRMRIAPIALAVAGIVLNWAMARANSSTWDVDFNQFYAAGKLVGTGHLYDWDAIRRVQLEHNGWPVPFGRIPAMALGFKAFSAIPYPVGRAIWFGIGVAALAGFVWLWPLERRGWVCVAVCWCAPAAMCLAYGQDTMLILFAIALGLRLLLRGQNFWAGVVWSACIAKPHLAVLLPVLLVARRNWMALVGGAAGGALTLAVSFAVEGRDWIARIAPVMSLPEWDRAIDRMPNLRGLVSFFGGSLVVEIALGLAVAVAVWIVSRRQPLAVSCGAAAAGGLMVSHHAFFYDCLILLPMLLLPWLEPRLAWARGWALGLLTPLPYVFLLTSAGLAGHIAITGYSLAVTMAAARLPAQKTNPTSTW